MTKAEIVASIGQWEAELANSESIRRDLERRRGGIGFNRATGGLVLLLAIVGAVFALSLWWLWAFLGLVGALTLGTALLKQYDTSRQLAECDRRIAKARATLAELRATLVNA
jgi:hypothetical protein